MDELNNEAVFYDTWAVLEIQSNGESLTVTPFSFTSYTQALQKFYELMVYVVASSVPEHTVMIIDKIGNVNKIETVYHNEVTE